MQKIKYIGISLCTLFFTQCEVAYDDFKPSNGEADFTKIVALGDSYTAGYTDGALGQRGQENGFSYILAKQLEQVGSEGFVQPLVQSESSVGGTEIAPGVMNGYYELQGSGSTLTPVPTVGDMSIYAERVYDANSPVQNLGVPGAKVSHLLAPGYATMNPYFTRFASDAATTSVIADAVAQNPTFVTLWIGGNDVLTYALAGGEADEVTTPVAFAQYYGMLAASLFGNGAKGAIANIPNINDLPYFSYVLSGGHLPLVIEDNEVPGGIRQLTEGEKILLSASSLLKSGYGQSVDMPIPDEFVLDLTEIAVIQKAISDYNQIISEIANSDDYNLALVDLNALMQQASTTGFLMDGVNYTSTFVTGGVFSLDGIHATGKGSAIIANAFINAINKKYNSNIPVAAINGYSAVEFPNAE